LMKKKVGQCHDVIFKGHGFYITDNRRIKTASDVM
jgi:predicted nucleic acid-binding Zn ribbon protein